MEKKLSGCVNLNDSENYQAIFASQSWYSFFVIYGKFKKNGDDLNIKLTIKNYAGPLKYKFKEKEIFSKFKEKGGVLRFMCELSAFGNYENAETERNVKINEKLTKIFVTRNKKSSDVFTISEDIILNRTSQDIISENIDETPENMKKLKEELIGYFGFEVSQNFDGHKAFSGNCNTSLVQVIDA